MDKFIKIIIIVFTIIVSFNSYAVDDIKHENLQFMYPAKLEINRPLFYKEQIKLQPLAINGNVDAEFETALRYYFGYVRHLDVPFYKSYSNAATWFMRSAEKGYVPSAYFLGNMYMYGKGVPQNYNKAIKYLHFARLHGVKQAKFLLAHISYMLYCNSNESDMYHLEYLKDARVLYSELANAGDPRAYYNLAVILLLTENDNRYLLDDAGALLSKAVEGFTFNKERIPALETLKLMRDWDMKAEEDARQIFNKAFATSSKGKYRSMN